MSELVYFVAGALLMVGIIVYIFNESPEQGWADRERQLQRRGLPSQRPADWETIHRRQKMLRIFQILFLGGFCSFLIVRILNF